MGRLPVREANRLGPTARSLNAVNQNMTGDDGPGYSWTLGWVELVRVPAPQPRQPVKPALCKVVLLAVARCKTPLEGSTGSAGLGWAGGQIGRSVDACKRRTGRQRANASAAAAPLRDARQRLTGLVAGGGQCTASPTARLHWSIRSPGGPVPGHSHPSTEPMQQQKQQPQSQATVGAAQRRHSPQDRQSSLQGLRERKYRNRQLGRPEIRSWATLSKQSNQPWQPGQIASQILTD